MDEHPLTSLTAAGLLFLLLCSFLLTPQPVRSDSRPTPGLELERATPAPPAEPADKATPDPYGTREPPQATRPPQPDGLTERVAKALGLAPTTLTVISATPVTWNDACLGCPQPGDRCLDVLTPGQQVIYQGPGGQRYDVRTGAGDHFIICPAAKEDRATAEPPQATRPPQPDGLTERVAKALGLAPTALTRVSATPVTWNDACLGCPQPGERCLEVLTPGQQVIYQGPGGQRYDVRTGAGDHFIICPSGGLVATAAPPPAVRKHLQVDVVLSNHNATAARGERVVLQPAPGLELNAVRVVAGAATAQLTADTVTVELLDLPAGDTVHLVVTVATDALLTELPQEAWLIPVAAANTESGLTVAAVPAMYQERLDLAASPAAPRRTPPTLLLLGSSAAALCVLGCLLYISWRPRVQSRR